MDHISLCNKQVRIYQLCLIQTNVQVFIQAYIYDVFDTLSNWNFLALPSKGTIPL